MTDAPEGLEAWQTRVHRPSYTTALLGVWRGVPEHIAKACGSAAAAMAAASRDARDCPLCGAPGVELLWGFCEWDEPKTRGPAACDRCAWVSLCTGCQQVVEVRDNYPELPKPRLWARHDASDCRCLQPSRPWLIAARAGRRSGGAALEAWRRASRCERIAMPD